MLTYSYAYIDLLSSYGKRIFSCILKSKTEVSQHDVILHLLRNQDLSFTNCHCP